MGDLDWLKNLIEKKKQMEEEAANTPKYEGPMPTITPGDLSKSWEEGPTKEKFANLGDFMYSLVRGALGLDASEKVYEAWKEGNPEKMVPGVVDMGLSVPELPEKLAAGVAKKGVVAFNDLFKDAAPAMGILIGKKGMRRLGINTETPEGLAGSGAFSLLQDKTMRKEISDEGLKLKDVPMGSGGQYKGSLESAVEHDKLYEAYPELRRHEYKTYEGLDPFVYGSFDPEKKSIYVNKRPATITQTVEEAQHGTATHEMQHAVDDIEGHPTGGNTEEFRPVIDNLDKLEAYYTRTGDRAKLNSVYNMYNKKPFFDARIKEIDNAQNTIREIQETTKDITGDLRQYDDAMVQRYLLAKAHTDELDKIKTELSNQYLEHLGKVRGLKIGDHEAYGNKSTELLEQLTDINKKVEMSTKNLTQIFNDLQEIRTLIHKLERTDEQSKLQDVIRKNTAELRRDIPSNLMSDAYHLTSGEMLARDADKRRLYTDEQRVKIPPLSSQNIMPEEAIIKERGKPGASISLDDLFK